jgi:tRNA ligase
LQWLSSSEGQATLHKESRSRPSSPEPTIAKQLRGQKSIIVPIAIPGCGKTAVAVALSNLFGFGHTQSDDVAPAGKKGRTASAFENNVKQLLESKDTVIADK